MKRNIVFLTTTTMKVLHHTSMMTLKKLARKQKEEQNQKQTRFKVSVILLSKKINSFQTKNISKEEIHLDIFSPNHPGDLQFIDLPGFTKCPVKNQDDDIEQQIEDLNFSYMKEDNTIMLAIHDATQDIANSDAMKYALG